VPEAVDPVWYILDKIQKDIDRIDEKWDSYLVQSTKLISNLEAVSAKVAELNKLLTQDNGKPSIVSQMNSLSLKLQNTTDDVIEIKSLVQKLSTDLERVQKSLGVKTPKEVSIERWKTIGKIGVALVAVLPGILSFFHNFF